MTIENSININFWKNKTILVTGGAGFIGSNLSNKICNYTEKIIIIDNFERKSSIKINKKIKIIKKDLRNYNLIKKHFENIDIVIHLASKVGSIKSYINNSYNILNSNIQIDKNVIDLAIKNKIKFFFYASSSHIYPFKFQKNYKEIKLKENMAYPAEPYLSYGWGKLFGEILIKEACSEKKIKTKFIIARFIGIYGAGQDYNLINGSVIPVFTYRAITYPKNKFKILGKGNEKRSYFYIDDAILCSLMLIEKFKSIKNGSDFNIGSEKSIKIIDIANQIIKLSNKNIKINFINNFNSKIKSQLCNVNKLKKTIDFYPNTSFQDGLRIVYNDIKYRIKK